MAGPIDLDFLKPRFLTEFDTPDGPVRVECRPHLCRMGQSQRADAARLRRPHVTERQGEEIATAPSVALSFEPRSVVRGQLLPTAIVVDRPTFDADITREGGMLQRVLAKSDSSRRASSSTC